MKEIADDTKHMERYTMFVGWRIDIVKMTILPKAVYGFIQSLSNYQQHFHRTTKNLQICTWRHTKPQITKAILKENRAEESDSLTSDYHNIVTQLYSNTK